MNNLIWFQSWYVKHSFNSKVDVCIKTSEQSGWVITIDLASTKYKEIPDYQYINNKEGIDWYKLELVNHIFKAEGNFTHLDLLIGKFRELIGELPKNDKKQDNFWDKNIQNFMFEDKEDVITFLHYTCSQDIANQIVETGFKFYDFDKSSFEAKNHSTELNYYHYLHKQFGDFVIVIAISRVVYFKYLTQINSTNSSVSRVEEILTEKPVTLNDNADMVYTLHKKFVKGYFNYYKKEIVKNSFHEPTLDSEVFGQNLKRNESK